MAYNLITGNSGNNILVGDTNPLNLNDEIIGLDGDDILRGHWGDNILRGGKGNDILKTHNTTTNKLYGGSGRDRLHGFYGNNIYNGGSGFDTLVIFQGFSSYLNPTTGVVMTLDSNDPSSGSIVFGTTTTIFKSIERFKIWGTNYDDILFGGKGKDYFFASPGNDSVSGGTGRDTIELRYYESNIAVNMNLTIDSNDPYSGSIVNHVYNINFQSIERFIIFGSRLGDLLYGGNGGDKIYTYDGDDTIYSGNGNDYIYDNQGSNNLYGGAGDDTIESFASNIYNNNIYGEDGDDTLKAGGGGNDNIYGGAGNDTIEVIAGNDLVDGGAGDDRLRFDFTHYPDANIGTTLSLNSNDRTSGTVTAGPNTINFSSIESFWVFGSDLDDSLFSGDGNDILNSRSGNDTIDAGGGDDTIIISKLVANDNIIGGTGIDELSLQYSHPTTGMVMSFNSNDPTSGSIVTDSKRLDFSSIERFSIYGTIHDDILLGGIGKDAIGTKSGNDLVNLYTADNAIDTVFYRRGDGRDTISFFESGVGGDILSFENISHVDLIRVGSNTEVRYGDGISGNQGFGSGELLITLNAVDIDSLIADNFKNAAFLSS